MLQYQEAFYLIRGQLTTVYDAEEAAAIAHQLLEYITGKNRIQRLADKTELLPEAEETAVKHALKRLLAGEPLQYVTGVQWFMGHPYVVNEHVLIPRPETEELVQWIADDWKNRGSLRILDVGTGSGCIPIALKQKLPNASVLSIDVSEAALQVAMRNREMASVLVDFRLTDFLQEDNWQHLGSFDVVVSNPPYIPQNYRDTLHTNVRDHEPGLALFVPDDDPLLFYRKIAAFGKEHLTEGGAIYCELHADHAHATVEMFGEMGYEDVALKKDIFGIDRMVRVRR